MADLRVGCSGWVYRHWRGDFYPERLRQKDEFAFYASRFDTAEINASFYRLPSETTVEAWAAKAPDGFVFAWKASRYITHLKRLKDVGDSLDLVMERMAPLGPHFGPALFQLPPSMKLDLKRLEGFLALLPHGRRCTIEFRHPSWYAEAVYAALRAANVALCLSDHHHAPAPFEATADWTYIRGHGPGGRYHGDYPQETLEAWAAHARRWLGEGKDVYAYFDNDIGGGAPRDALRLRDLIRPAR